MSVYAWIHYHNSSGISYYIRKEDLMDWAIIPLVDAAQSVPTCLVSSTPMVRKPEYSDQPRPMLCLLLPWLLTSPGHQLPWYWLCQMGGFIASTGKGSSMPSLFWETYGHAHFVYDWPWISTWMKAVYKELDVTRHGSASYLLGPALHCAIFCDANTANGIRRRRMKIGFLSSFTGLFHGRKIVFVLLRRTVHALSRVLFVCLFLYLISISGINKEIPL